MAPSMPSKAAEPGDVGGLNQPAGLHPGMTRILDNSGLKSSYLSNSMDNIDDNTTCNIVYEMTIHDNTSTELLLCRIQYKAILYNTFEY